MLYLEGDPNVALYLVRMKHSALQQEADLDGSIDRPEPMEAGYGVLPFQK